MSNLSKRLDRLERLAGELLTRNEGPVYLSEGEVIPEGIDASRVITIAMRWVDAAERPEEPKEPLPLQGKQSNVIPLKANRR